MERRKLGGIVPRRVHVDKNQGCSVRWLQKKPALDVQTILAFIIESVSWVTEDFLWDHEWITETKVTMKRNLILEALHHDIDVPCPLPWSLLWSPAPTNLNRKFVNNGTIVAKFMDTVSSAIELTCNIAFDGAHTPRECFFQAVAILLSYAPDKVEEEMQGWCVGEKRIARLSAVRGSVGRAMNSEQSHSPCHKSRLFP